MIVWSFVIVLAVIPLEVKACGGTFTEPTGTIQSPGYPSTSENNLDCVYIIRRPWGERITLNFTAFDVEESSFFLPDCYYDRVTIRDGASESSPLLDIFCGTELPPVRRSFQNVMYIRFQTDSSVVGTGFNATYTSAVHNDSFFLITDSRNDALYHIDKDTFSHVELPVTSLPFAVDYDPVERRMFWTDFYSRSIHTAYLNNTDSRALWTSNSAGAQLTGLAVDAVSRLLFYVDAENRVIGVVSMSGSSHKTIVTVSIGSPRCITLDTTNGVMYWTDVGTPEKIERASYDGSNRTVLVSLDLYVPNGLAVDLTNNRLYWVDAGTDRLESSDLNGNNRRVMYNQSLAHFFGLALHQDKLYVTDWGYYGAQTTSSNLLEISIDGVQVKTRGTASGKMNDVHIYSDETWLGEPNGCSTNRGQCSHFCIPSPGNGFKCICPDGMRLKSDQRTCESDGSSTTTVVTTQRPSTTTKGTTSGGCGGNFTEREGAFQSPGHPANYAYNLDCVYVITRPLGERITLNFTAFRLERDDFFGDCTYDNVTIYDGSTNRSPILDILCGDGIPLPVRTFQNTMYIRFRTDSSIAYSGFYATYTSAVLNDSFYLITDSVSRVVFYVDYDTFSYIAIPLTLYSPFAVDYDPVNRNLYWTDLTTSDIRSANMDGSNVQRLWASPHSNSRLTGLAVDPLSRLVFYVDAASHVIGVITMSGSSHKTIITEDTDDPQCITLDTINGVMYWTDAGTPDKIEKANYDGSDRKVLVNITLYTPNGLAVDLANNLLYWVDAGTDRVESVDLEGNGRRVVYSKPLSHFYGLALHQDKLYITDWGLSGNNTRISYLLEVGTDGSNPRARGRTSGRMNDIHIYSDDTWQQGPNGCSMNRGLCSHMCIPTPDNHFKCLCPDGWYLAEDQMKCGNVSVSTTTSPSAPVTIRLDGPKPLFDTDGRQDMNLTCDPDGSKPVASVTWNVTCRQQNKQCVWTPKPPEDDGKVVMCSITYTDGRSAVGYFRAQLNYPPPSAPEIYGYRSGDLLNAGDTLSMTCIVPGGKPLVTSVTFSCPGHPDATDNHPDIVQDTQVQSLLLIKPLRTEDRGLKCVCAAEWKKTDWYTLSSAVVLNVNVPGTDSVTASPGSQTGSASNSTAVAGGVTAAIGLIIILLLVIVAIIIIKRRRKARADGQNVPIVWHAEPMPYSLPGYHVDSHLARDVAPPAYTNALYDQAPTNRDRATNQEPAGAEGGNVVAILPPKPGAPPPAPLNDYTPATPATSGL